MNRRSHSRHTLRDSAWVLCLLLCVASQGYAQQTDTLSSTDLQRLRQKDIHCPLTADRHVHYGFGASHQWYNPFYHLLSSGMYVYQRCVSPVISRSCAFAPSCSGYSKALIHEYGLAKGMICTADRLMRCNRISLADPTNQSLINPSDGHIHESVDRYRLK